ncbi:SGNH/GDSL hydrolase family protein [Jatrophihabitans sp. GAS493]|uniref:SGNH/GDSL hydrolase family protein n=1 Tax=Jatrophihabitans sp. GAS493 TaxID=1907575 RepID=UPI000BB7F398|nr:SGNH/GDSL hydrolase family protein [Jatrophihabitans sp. GAS493]
MASIRLIVSLGSSFAAGPGIEPVADVAAMRSEKNYAHQLAERLGARLVDLTVSGATTANVLDTPQQTLGGITFPPQTDGIPRDADVVTITAGGNDLQFIGAMLYFSWLRADPGAPIVAMMGTEYSNGVPLPTEHAIERATDGLVTVIEKARVQAPKARVLLVDYLTVLDAGSASAVSFSQEELDQFRTIQNAIGRVFRDAATRTGAELIRASALSVEHALGSTEPWVQPFHQVLEQTGGSFHPNAEGMTAIAAQLEQVLSS